MGPPFENVVSEFDRLTAADFDPRNPQARGWERLDDLCEELRSADTPWRAVPILLRTLERLDGIDPDGRRVASS